MKRKHDISSNSLESRPINNKKNNTTDSLESKHDSDSNAQCWTDLLNSDSNIASNLETRYLPQSQDGVNQEFKNKALRSLYDAVLSSDTSRLKSVIKQYSKYINIPDDEGNCTIHYTTDFDMVKILIHAGCDVNIKNTKGYTPLINAIINSEYTTMLLLLANGADPTVSEPVFDIKPKTLCEYPGVIKLFEEYETEWHQKNGHLLGEHQSLESDITGA